MSEIERIRAARREFESRAGSRYDPHNQGNQHILAERRSLAGDLLDRAGLVPLGRRKVLDVGCGTGEDLAWLLELGGSPDRMVGVDLLSGRVTAARHAHPTLEFKVGNAERLDHPDGSFDLVMAHTVFSSILDEQMSRGVAAEIVRVLRPRGALLWYDVRYNNPSNPGTRGLTAAQVHRLFPSLEGTLRSVTVLPPVARGLGPLAPVLYPALAAVPPLRGHLLGLLRKPA